MISVRELVKLRGGQRVLDSVSLDVRPGEVTAVIGPSGGGKSTLLRCINGLETYQSGAITADGIEVGSEGTNLRELRAIGRDGAALNGKPRRPLVDFLWGRRSDFAVDFACLPRREA